MLHAYIPFEDERVKYRYLRTNNESRRKLDDPTDVIGNDGDVFSAGADLREILGACKEGKFSDIDRLLRPFKALFNDKYAISSVSCPRA